MRAAESLPAPPARKLSEQLRRYYNRHLDPYDNPDTKDIKALQAIEEAQRAFDIRLNEGFERALKELEQLGYPGVTDPKLNISTRLRPVEGLNHEAAVRYVIQMTDGAEVTNLHLPEDSNGLGYQNLISMVFRLMSYRDAWMLVGKAEAKATSAKVFRPPLHLVLIEEPEAHLHTQVQQVFIRQAYKILRSHDDLGDKPGLTTQMVVSTHSSHIAHECEFASLRYFRRIAASKNEISTSCVVDVSKAFGTDIETSRFVTRYVKVTHCDLFFADAAVLIEGPAERILTPHFVREHAEFKDLRECYITWLEIGGSHAHRLRGLIECLALPTLIRMQRVRRLIVDALLVVQAAHAGQFSLGFIGDTMQRIYNDGKEKIEDELPEEWARPAKRLNHRCPKRVVRLINRIRGQVDDHTQEARSDSVEGLVRLFVFPADIADKPALEDWIRAHMASLTGDADWNERQKCKILTLEHHMAAKRMGFATIFESLGAIDDFRTGLLDGTLPVTRLFTANVLPLVIAQRKEDKFATAKVVRDFSPLLDAQTIKEAPDQREQLRIARSAVEGLMKLWANGEPTCGAVLMNVAESGLFSLPESLRALIQRRDIPEAERADAEAESADPVPEEIIALESFLAAPFSEIGPYARYVSNEAEFGTHQGVKGLEFDRVMVLMDDGEARGFMFGYEKFFGAKELNFNRREERGRRS